MLDKLYPSPIEENWTNLWAKNGHRINIPPVFHCPSSTSALFTFFVGNCPVPCTKLTFVSIHSLHPPEASNISQPLVTARMSPNIAKYS